MVYAFYFNQIADSHLRGGDLRLRRYCTLIDRRSSRVNAELSQLFLDPVYLSLDTPPGKQGWKRHPVAAVAGVVGDPFVSFFCVAVEKRISELSPGLREAGYEMVYSFEKSGALRLCLVKLPQQAGDPPPDMLGSPSGRAVRPSAPARYLTANEDRLRELAGKMGQRR